MDTAEALKQVQALLREGKTQEADDLINEHNAALTAAGSPDAPPPAPRTIGEIVKELATELTQHLGSPTRLVELLKELEPFFAKL